MYVTKRLAPLCADELGRSAQSINQTNRIALHIKESNLRLTFIHF